jgi:hypothetical protein
MARRTSNWKLRPKASGAVGETIPVRNPESHKRFAARVEGKGRVSVGSCRRQGESMNRIAAMP